MLFFLWNLRIPSGHRSFNLLSLTIYPPSLSLAPIYLLDPPSSRPRHRLPLLIRHPRQLHNPNPIPRIPRINDNLSTPNRLHHILIIPSDPSPHSRISPNPFVPFLVVGLVRVELLVGGECAVEGLGLDAEGGVGCRHAGYRVFFLGVGSVLFLC